MQFIMDKEYKINADYEFLVHFKVWIHFEGQRRKTN
jgi:hypothetical protein